MEETKKKSRTGWIIGGLAVAGLAFWWVKHHGPSGASNKPSGGGSSAVSTGGGSGGGGGTSNTPASPGGATRILTPGVNTPAQGYDGSGINPGAGSPSVPSSPLTTPSMPVTKPPLPVPVTSTQAPTPSPSGSYTQAVVLQPGTVQSSSLPAASPYQPFSPPAVPSGGGSWESGGALRPIKRQIMLAGVPGQ